MCRPVLVIGLVVMILLCGCQFNHGHKFEHRGETREYDIYTPPSLNKRSGKNKPLLLVLHGNPSAGWQMRLYTGMDKIARREDFIVAYPTARTRKWPIEDNTAIENEAAYINSVLDDIIKRYPVDTSRIYLAGISGGGIFSFIMANRIPQRLSAIGVVAGNLSTCIDSSANNPMPTILIHGTEDFLYHGRNNLLSVDSTLAFMQRVNGCSGTPDIRPVFDSRKDNTTVEIVEFACRTPLIFYLIHGGGHHWPGGSFNADRFTKLDLGNFYRDINASELIWNFVSNHRK